MDRVASYWVGIWRDRGDGLPSWSAGGLGAPVPNIACLPSRNEIWSARVAHLAHQAGHFGTATGSVATDMAKVDGAIQIHASLCDLPARVSEPNP